MRLVGETLDRDIAEGRSHLAMVRCKKIARVKDLHSKYAAALPRYNPVIVHSEQSEAERRQNLAALRQFESRIIVCVDMLGEGFDLPELKIAGVHDVFASVAVTLQFVGRFARARDDLGIATVIANTDQDRVDRALAKLYAEEADWNILVSTINADRVGREMGRAEVLAGFTGELKEVPLQTIEPTMSTLVFRAKQCENWDPHRIEDVAPAGSFIGMKLNQKERIAVCVLRHEKIAKWTTSATATDVVWELVLAHWDENAGLLYLTGTGGSASDDLAKAICGDQTMAEYFADDAPQIDFGDGSFLIYSHLYVPPKELNLAPVMDTAIVPWNWTGTNPRIESQGPERRPDSIQYRVIQELKKGDYDIIFDDDGTGEFADVIAIKIRETTVDVLMCHCKYAGTDAGAARLDDLYEVAGQSLKSVQFCHKPKRFLRNILNREKRRLERGEPTRFDRGTIGALRRLYASWDQYRFEYKVWIVQPGISKTAATQPILQLLGLVEKALINHRRIPLTVIVRD